MHKNPATEGGKDILWRIYKKNRFRELFLVGTDSTPTPFVKIQQPFCFGGFILPVHYEQVVTTC